jgi:hypothetical protein
MAATTRRSVTLDRSRSSRRQREQQTFRAPIASNTSAEHEYRVGPGRPPKEFQFRPGVSGNPKGAKRKTPSIAPDLKALLERALREKVKLRCGEKEEIISKAAAGIAQLVNQFVEGDRHARRDLIALAKTLGVDLTAGQAQVIEKALAPPLIPDDQALADDYVRRRWNELNNPQNEPDLGLSRSEESKDSPEEKPK